MAIKKEPQRGEIMTGCIVFINVAESPSSICHLECRWSFVIPEDFEERKIYPGSNLPAGEILNKSYRIFQEGKAEGSWSMSEFS